MLRQDFASISIIPVMPIMPIILIMLIITIILIILIILIIPTCRADIRRQLNKTPRFLSIPGRSLLTNAKS